MNNISLIRNNGLMFIGNKRFYNSTSRVTPQLKTCGKKRKKAAKKYVELIKETPCSIVDVRARVKNVTHEQIISSVKQNLDISPSKVKSLLCDLHKSIDVYNVVMQRLTKHFQISFEIHSMIEKEIDTNISFSTCKYIYTEIIAELQELICYLKSVTSEFGNEETKLYFIHYKNLLKNIENLSDNFKILLSCYNAEHLKQIVISKKSDFIFINNLCKEELFILKKIDYQCVVQLLNIKLLKYSKVQMYTYNDDFTYLEKKSTVDVDSKNYKIVDDNVYGHLSDLQFSSQAEVFPMNILTESEVSSFINENLNLNNKANANNGSVKVESEVYSDSSNILFENEKDLKRFSVLQSFLDVSLELGNLKQAQLALILYEQNLKNSLEKNHHENQKITLYNIIMEGFSSKGNLTSCKKWLKIMHMNNIEPNLKSYALLLECLGYSSNTNDTLKSEVKIILNKMIQKKLNINDIFNKYKFKDNQYQSILKAIRLCHPKYELPAFESFEFYTCKVLKNLNFKKVKPPCITDNSILSTDMQKLVSEQIEAEVKCNVVIPSVCSTPQQKNNKVKSWRTKLHFSFRNAIKKLEIQENNQSCPILILPFLKVLEMKTYIDLMIEEIRTLAQGHETFSPSLSFLSLRLGYKVFSRYHIYWKQKYSIIEHIKLICSQMTNYHINPELSKQYLPREYWKYLIQENALYSSLIVNKKWPFEILMQIGKFLYDQIFSCKINIHEFHIKQCSEVFVPCFYKVLRNYGIRHREEVKLHPVFTKLYNLHANNELIFEITDLPMICPPVPWISVSYGGFLILPTDFVRIFSDTYKQNTVMNNVPNSQLYPIFDSLNYLGCVPWKINEFVLDIILNIFQNNGNPDLDIPSPSSQLQLPSKLSKNLSDKQRAEILKARAVYHRQKSEMHSLWCSTLYKLSIANYFRKCTIWFPHNIDFRGRVYPCSPHFNYMGADVTRSLLLFAHGKPLGEKGVNWLKIHLINLTGFKKHDSVLERLAFADDNIDDIIDSADNPLNGRKWWMKSEEPWQTLAACRELASALRSPVPSQYISHLPIHQDGSCNGLQHYAALGRDSLGAHSVNLSYSEKPEDVYERVTILVEKIRKEHANQGVEIAAALEGFIKRKVIKQTVMTTVYGVTNFGARLQILKQLKNLHFPEDKLWAASRYLVKNTFCCIHEMFSSARDIQTWFNECARLITSVVGKNVEWITPLGLPIIQPYINKKSALCFKPDVAKQKNAFPPNFIHSLDACHMMLTCLFCNKANVTFVAVHDCFWTHANSVDVLNKICREQFIVLHSLPILNDLSEFLKKKVNFKESLLKENGSVKEIMKKKLNRTLAEIPLKGNFDINEVLDSIYFFS